MFLLGLSDKGKEGDWRWDSDGSTVSYTNWEPAEPDNGQYGGRHVEDGEDCVVMLRDYAKVRRWKVYSWGDIPCPTDSYWDGQPKHLICQKVGMWVCFF